MHQRLLPDGVERRPEWLTVKLPAGDGYNQIKSLMRGLDLVTVCEEARCPNIAECWGHGTATFMILGEVCTRACAFCAVTSGKRGGDIDADEPRRVGAAVAQMGLAHAVVTSVDRDDLPDFGAALFADTIHEIRRQSPGTTIEVLTPDFNGRLESLRIVMESRPEIFNHNLETVARLQRAARPSAGYARSLSVLGRAKRDALGALADPAAELGRELRLLLRSHDVELEADGADALERRDPALHLLLEARAEGAAGDGERDRDRDVAVRDLDVAHHVELGHRPPELGVDDLFEGLADLVAYVVHRHFERTRGPMIGVCLSVVQNALQWNRDCNSASFPAGRTRRLAGTGRNRTPTRHHPRRSGPAGADRRDPRGRPRARS